MRGYRWDFWLHFWYTDALSSVYEISMVPTTLCMTAWVGKTFCQQLVNRLACRSGILARFYVCTTMPLLKSLKQIFISLKVSWRLCQLVDTNLIHLESLHTNSRYKRGIRVTHPGILLQSRSTAQLCLKTDTLPCLRRACTSAGWSRDKFVPILFR